MIAIHTNDLTGAALDWAVAQAENQRVNVILVTEQASAGFYTVVWEGFDESYNPSTNWGIAGPIIERLRMRLVPWDREPDRPMHGWWTAGIYDMQGSVNGRTMLEAAMRCYVSHAIGYRIDIPDELAYTDSAGE
jgi:hypothetical protein